MKAQIVVLIIILMILIPLLFLLITEGDSLPPMGDSLTLICNGDDCTWFPTDVVKRQIPTNSDKCTWMYAPSRGEYVQCIPFRKLR